MTRPGGWGVGRWGEGTRGVARSHRAFWAAVRSLDLFLSVMRATDYDGCFKLYFKYIFIKINK